MRTIEQTINKYKLIKAKDKVGIAVSGGKDSMCLLHYLKKISAERNIEPIAITIDHCLRENSKKDAEFVVNYCNKHNIKVYMYKINAKKLSEDKGLTIEQAARECRFKIFKALVSKGIVNKVALAHHMQDQAETILLNIFRGTGTAGASGMDVVRDGIYIRPLLRSSKAEIMAYIAANEIPYIEDETNNSNDFARNYIRNMVMPLIRTKWSSADSNICSFGDLCRQDDEYVYSTIIDDAILYENNGTVRIPTSYFVYPEAVKYRVLMKAFKSIGVISDIERKHLIIINGLALEAENGSKISLPNKLTVIKEYNYVTITNKSFTPSPRIWPLDKGKIDIPEFGVIEMQMLRKFNVGDYSHVVDYNKIPKDAVWRYRKDGDVFVKFGGGTKSLSDYLIDKKIPARLRTFTPVLASGNQILVIAGVEISDKVKIDESTKTAWGINSVRFI